MDSFVFIINKIELSEEDQVALFVKGLKEGNTELINVLNPKSLQHTIIFGKVLASEEDHHKNKGRIEDMKVSSTPPECWLNAQQEGTGSEVKTEQGAIKGPRPGSMLATNEISVYLPTH